MTLLVSWGTQPLRIQFRFPSFPSSASFAPLRPLHRCAFALFFLRITPPVFSFSRFECFF